MNRTVATVIMLAFFALFIGGEVAHLKRWAWPEDVTMLAAFCCLAFGRISAGLSAGKSRNIKLGSETLPPIADIASVSVDGIPISEARRDMLLKAMAKSKRAASGGKILQEVPFQIHDRWDGTWTFLAYEDDQGNRGFSINRVYYAGPSARFVAECVGLRR